MSKNKQTSDKPKNGNDFIADVSSMLVANGLPAFGTKEFNDMCSQFFGGKPSVARPSELLSSSACVARPSGSDGCTQVCTYQH